LSNPPVDLSEIRRDLLLAIATEAKQGARHRLRSRLVAAAAGFAVLATAAGAIAAGVLKSAAEQERGILEGDYVFHGSDPTCEQLSATSFRCTLARPPAGMTFYDESGKQILNAFLGVKRLTVDSTLHVDGACVSTRADGRTWACYLGQEAVQRGALDPEMLGRYWPEPGTG
jgi:hypothetical protein